jgi:hypothetical protein
LGTLEILRLEPFGVQSREYALGLNGREHIVTVAGERRDGAWRELLTLEGKLTEGDELTDLSQGVKAIDWVI